MNQNPTRCDAPRCLDPLSLIHGSPPGPRSFKQWLDSTRARAEMRGGQTSGWMGNVSRDRSARIAVTRRGLRRLGGRPQVVADVAQGSGGKGEVGPADGRMGDLVRCAAAGEDLAPDAEGVELAGEEGAGAGRGAVARRPAAAMKPRWGMAAARQRADGQVRPEEDLGVAGHPPLERRAARGRSSPRRRGGSGRRGVDAAIAGPAEPEGQVDVLVIATEERVERPDASRGPRRGRRRSSRWRRRPPRRAGPTRTRPTGRGLASSASRPGVASRRPSRPGRGRSGPGPAGRPSRPSGRRTGARPASIQPAVTSVSLFRSWMKRPARRRSRRWPRRRSRGSARAGPGGRRDTSAPAIRPCRRSSRRRRR